jgi:hypothetical protein
MGRPLGIKNGEHRSICNRGHNVGRNSFGHCKACHLINGRNCYKRNIVKMRTQARIKASTPAYKAVTRNWRLKKNFGISLEDYNRMFQEQQGLCLGCYQHQSSFNKAFAVDHDHVTGKVRGLLCMKCNSILGYAADSSIILRRLADYADKHKEII